ncbi:MAG: ABC transporter permease, partial [Lentisphaerota bacterium]
MNRSSTFQTLGLRCLGYVTALLIVVCFLFFTGAQPFRVLASMLNGSVGSLNMLSDVMVLWVPLLLISSGLLVTFAGGMWNIGVEGQITLGAVFATGAMRAWQTSALPPWLLIVGALAAGIAGGMFWASLAGGLKIFGGVSEIFGGLGLNFVATTFTLWLVFGPWKRPGTGSMSGTDPFPEMLWLPTLGTTRLSGWMLLIALAAVVMIWILLHRTRFGLKLKAVGHNPKAAGLLGVPVRRQLLGSLLICGGLAGLAGALQVAAVYHRLIPSISSGYGFLGLLIVMLAHYRLPGVIAAAFLFAALNIGSIQLPIVYQMDSSLAGVLQGLLVLCVLMMNG